MVLVKEVSEGRVRDRSDHETAVLKHVIVDEMQWVDDGRYGLLDGQVESASKKIQEAIIITAKVKQMDPTGFLEVCGARTQGLTVVGKTGDPASHAVAFLLNNLEPAEANSLAGGTDVTDNAVMRAMNAARVEAVADHEVALLHKVGKWEESHDRSTSKHGANYLNRAQREVEMDRRDAMTPEQRKGLPPMRGRSVLPRLNTSAAKSILGTA
tara:strand:+ start:110 stop:745 length:636 start_codon:yes stop_codon:yes gene_type:complete